MKHTKHTKAIIFILCLASFNGLFAQFYGIKHYNGEFSDTSIVRQWNEQLYVVYSQTPNGNYFLLTNSEGDYHTKFLTHIEVKDMEIVDDTLYYCGIDRNTNEAIVGHFNINEMNNSSVFEYFARFAVFSIYPGHYLLPKRLEVIHNSFCVHVVMVCDLFFPSDTVKKVMADAISPHSSSSWYLHIINHDNVMVDRNNIFHPDDVAVTDNYIVFAGHKHSSAGIYIAVFPIPTNSLDFLLFSLGFPSYCCRLFCYTNSQNNYSVLGERDGEHPVWCTRLTEDDFAIACMSRVQRTTGPEYGSTIKTISAATLFAAPYPMSPMNPIRNLYFPYSSFLNRKWAVRDLRYDKDSNNILMLYDYDNPMDGTLESMTMTLNPSTLQRTTYYTGSKVWQHSIDKSYNYAHLFTSCGVNPISSILMHTYFEQNHTNCTPTFIPIIEEVDGDMEDFSVTFNPESFQGSEVRIKRATMDQESAVYCE